ncbi:MFS transporter [Chromatiaceae bacterium AAb-1]|nr:MFS transporter [Chromatiaceae bacterium AAb-1]
MPLPNTSAANSWLNTGYLLCSFALWLHWSVITVQMLNLGFAYSLTELYSLLAIAGLSGAVLKIPAGYFSTLFGCRNTTLITSLLLLLPSIGAGIALQYPDFPLWGLQLLALLSGLGGANIMVALTNSHYFTTRHQLAAQELTLGIGQLGISLVQLTGPLLMSIALFSFADSPQLRLQQNSGNLLGAISEGQPLWLQNTSWFWAGLLLLLAVIIGLKMKNPPRQAAIPSFWYSLCWITLLLLLSLLPVAAGLWLLLTNSFSLSANLVLVLILLTTLLILKVIPGPLQSLIEQQYTALNSKHCWVICCLYAAIFGSLIGFSAAMPLTLKVIFGYSQLPEAATINPNAPAALTYSWLLPFTAVLLYPSGSWLSVRWGSAKVIQACLALMLPAMLAAAWYMHQASHSTQPEQFFLPFLLCFIVVMAGCGLANSACLLLIQRVFPVSLRSTVLHNCMAVAALGAFYIPHLLSLYLTQHKPANALVNFAFFYLLCLFLNGFFYLRQKAEFYNP